MNLKGSRKSKNVEDISKQKKKFDILPSGYDYPDLNIKRGQMVKARTQKSKTPIKDTGPVRTAMGNKAGLGAMDEAATKDKIVIAYNKQKKDDIEYNLDKAFSKENTSKGPAGYDKLTEATAPTQLKEIWTPRPFTKKATKGK